MTATRADIREMALDSRPRPRPDTNLFGETRRPKAPLGLVYGRLMTCTGPCGGIVDVTELPGPYIDPKEYVCGDCQEARSQARPAEEAERSGG